jgi:transcriptional regulator with XRE-family HTH domain
MIGCRCRDCTRANTDYARQRERRQARIRYGIEPPAPPRLVDTTEAREHIHWLRTQRIGLRTIAQRTGLGRSALQQIANGTRQQALRSTVNAILAVNSTRKPGHTLVDATRTLQQLDQLLHLGHTKAELARRLGVGRTLQYRPGLITETTRRKVDALHQALTDPNR